VAEGLTLVADSSAWIGFYRSGPSAMKRLLSEALENHTVLLPDLVMVEVLRGIASEKTAKAIAQEFDNFQVIDLGGKENALLSAKHYRFLRAKGITVRGTVDLLIATWCIRNDVPLLHADRDFDGFETHLGLRRWTTTEVIED
jgi:predicted nucleic acid-binding protein